MIHVVVDDLAFHASDAIVRPAAVRSSSGACAYSVISQSAPPS